MVTLNSKKKQTIMLRMIQQKPLKTIVYPHYPVTKDSAYKSNKQLPLILLQLLL